MAKISYVEDDLYNVVIDSDNGNVSLGGESYINDSKREAYIFQLAYLMGREHKKSQIAQALCLLKN